MKYAYKDKEKKQMIFIDEAIEHTNYYCLNHNCSGILRACALDSIIPSYFSARISSHSEGCQYEKTYLNIKKYSKDKFNLDNFFKIISSKKCSSIKSISTIPSENNQKETLNQNIIPLPNSIFQVYKYCLNSSLEDTLSGKKIIEILADLRSEYFYTKIIWGKKIVEGKLIFIDSKNKLLTIQYPADLEKNKIKKYIYLKIKIDYPVNMNLFQRNEIYIIGGYFDNFGITLSNKKQIKLLKK